MSDEDKAKETPQPQLDNKAAEQIGALKAQLEQEQAARAAAEANVGAVQTLFNPGATDEVRQAALLEVMKTGGISEADAQAMFEDWTQEAPPAGQDDVPPAGAEGKENKPDPQAQRIDQLEAQVMAMHQARSESAKADSKRALEAQVAKTWEKSPDALDITQRLTQARDEETANKIASALQKDILREAIENLYSRKAQVGKFNPDWIPDEVEKAATATLEKARILGVTEHVGKAPGALDEEVMLSEIASKEIQAPTFDADRTPSENAESADDFTVKRLQQIAAQHMARAAGGASKA
jgi:hypothetical protein